MLRRLARSMLAVPFVYDGLDAALHPAEHVAAVRPVAGKVTDKLGRDALTDEQLTMAARAYGGTTVLLGLCLALGIFPRLCALKLAALQAPLVVVHQPFGAKGAARKAKTPRFVRAIGCLGAALIAGMDSEGKPGMAYRVGQYRAWAEYQLALKQGSGDGPVA